MEERFLIFGHRGSPRRFPENTLASFDEALRAGADGFETDLRLLSDRTAILYHDDELGEAEIESFSMPELAERGVVVQRVTDLVPYAQRTRMILEVKRSRWEDVLVERVSGWPNIVVASFDHSIIRSLHRRGVRFDLGITVLGSIVNLADYAAGLGATWCFPAYQYVDEEMVGSLHDHDIRVVPWTPNRIVDWARLREARCDGVITDVPHDAVAWRSQFADRRSHG
ncbi:MAG TPA: glycerophosphodiester phosphodiesterase [Thermoanaerobaculia bacterium]